MIAGRFVEKVKSGNLVGAERQDGYGDEQVCAGERHDHPVGERAHLAERGHRRDDERVADDDADDQQRHERRDEDRFDEGRRRRRGSRRSRVAELRRRVRQHVVPGDHRCPDPRIRDVIVANSHHDFLTTSSRKSFDLVARKSADLSRTSRGSHELVAGK